MQSLLPDETRFLGASWTALRTTEACLVTTESRLTPSASPALTGDDWVLSATSSRFACPGCLVSESIAVGVRGTGTSQKLVRFVQGSAAEQHAEGLDSSANVLSVFAIPKTESVVIVYENCACEVRSALGSFPLISDKILATGSSGAENEGSSKGKKKKSESKTSASSIVAASFLATKSCVVLVTNLGQLAVVRVVDRLESGSAEMRHNPQERYSLQVEVVNLPQNLHHVKNAVIHSSRSDAPSFAVSLVTSDNAFASVSIAVNTLKVETLVDLGRSRLEASEDDALEGTVGYRLLRYNAQDSRLEAWDYIHGVLLEVWPLSIEGGCTFIRSSPSGKTALVGNDKQLHIVQINCADEPSSLARVLGALSRFTPSKSAEQAGTRSAKKKHSKRSDVEVTIDDQMKKPRTMLDQVAASISEAFADKSYDFLMRLLDDNVLSSIRSLEGCLVTSVEDGRVDFTVKALEKCPDVSADAVVSLVRFLLDIAAQGNSHESQSAVKALTTLGGSLDKGVSFLLTKALTCPSLVEKELVHALARSLRHSEEVSAIVASLVTVGEASPNRDAFINSLLSASLVLDAQPLVKIPADSAPILDSLRQVVQRELALCDRTEQTLHQMHILLHDPIAVKQQQQRSGGEYRTETVLL